MGPVSGQARRCALAFRLQEGRTLAQRPHDPTPALDYRGRVSPAAPPRLAQWGRRTTGPLTEDSETGNATVRVKCWLLGEQRARPTDGSRVVGSFPPEVAGHPDARADTFVSSTGRRTETCSSEGRRLSTRIVARCSRTTVVVTTSCAEASLAPGCRWVQARHVTKRRCESRRAATSSTRRPCPMRSTPASSRAHAAVCRRPRAVAAGPAHPGFITAQGPPSPPRGAATRGGTQDRTPPPYCFS
jgi:hypothetical protein